MVPYACSFPAFVSCAAQGFKLRTRRSVSLVRFWEGIFLTHSRAPRRQGESCSPVLWGRGSAARQGAGRGCHTPQNGSRSEHGALPGAARAWAVNTASLTLALLLWWSNCWQYHQQCPHQNPASSMWSWVAQCGCSEADVAGPMAVTNPLLRLSLPGAVSPAALLEHDLTLSSSKDVTALSSEQITTEPPGSYRGMVPCLFWGLSTGLGVTWGMLG